MFALKARLYFLDAWRDGVILSLLAKISPEATKENALVYVRVGTPAMQQLHADMPSEAISAMPIIPLVL